MLSENLKRIRKAKGLSQEDLAVRVNVVRQTISKWEKGLSVPDSELLIALAEVLEVPVSTLLGETITENIAQSNAEQRCLAENMTVSGGGELKRISEKLETLNLQLAQRKETRRKLLRGIMIGICVGIVLLFAAVLAWGSPYQNWNFYDPETAVAGTLLHGFEWLFVRAAPILLFGAGAGIYLTRKKR